MYTFRAEVPAEHVKELLKAGIEKETGTPIHSIDFNIRTITTGYGPAEHEVQVFDGVIVQFKDRFEK